MVNTKLTRCLLGLAVGDALGCTLEFKKPGTFEPINNIVGGGVHQLKAGEWTDDTSMALCLAQSLIDCKGFDAKGGWCGKLCISLSPTHPPQPQPFKNSLLRK